MGRINLVGSTHLQSVGLDLARHRAVLFLEEGVIGLRGFCCQLNLPHCRCGEDPETRSTPGADVDRRIGEDQGGARATLTCFASSLMFVALLPTTDVENQSRRLSASMLAKAE
jgi:hypothetical protein